MKEPTLSKEPLLAREGWPFVFTPVVTAIVTYWLGWQTTSIILMLLAIGAAFFFRNPRRWIPDDPRTIVAPADGKVLNIGAAEENADLGQQKSRRVSIFLSVLNVHVNRYPCYGKVDSVKYTPGRFFWAFLEKASLHNERNATLLITPEGQKVLVTQIASPMARRIVCYAKTGDEVKRGELMGLIRFGSRVDLWIPAEWTVFAKPGQNLKGGESIIALKEDRS